MRLNCHLEINLYSTTLLGAEFNHFVSYFLDEFLLLRLESLLNINYFVKILFELEEH
jgi:hypothetical protein